jgi:DNA polymerase V
MITLSTGFPSPAEEYIEGPLDLNRYLISHPAATFFVRVSGDSMIGAGIRSGDLLIVDRAVTPQHGNVIIAVINGDLTIKRLHESNQQIVLISENPNYTPIEITEAMEFHVWGVVTKAILYSAKNWTFLND